MRRRNFNLSELAASVVAALAEPYPECKVAITIQADMIADGDPGLLRAALDNLIGNALKYTAKAVSPAIEIGVGRRDGRTIYFVRDNGVGFDMQYAHKLFAPFQRLHHASEFEGTGIGLATVKKIVQRHGGEVWIESAVNLGTTVSFTLGQPN
jgi:light-regulated signal transduction histidine kinase (bacteriophytochrome)